jgi:hypothetical protein
MATNMAMDIIIVSAQSFQVTFDAYILIRQGTCFTRREASNRFPDFHCSATQ